MDQLKQFLKNALVDYALLVRNPEIREPKIISKIKPCRETKPKAETWQDPTYFEKYQKQPLKGHLKATSLTFLSLIIFFGKCFESLCKIMRESENIFQKLPSKASSLQFNLWPQVENNFLWNQPAEFNQI